MFNTMLGMLRRQYDGRLEDVWSPPTGANDPRKEFKGDREIHAKRMKVRESRS